MSDHTRIILLLTEVGLAVAFGTAALYTHWRRQDLVPTLKTLNPEAAEIRHNRAGRRVHAFLVLGAIFTAFTVIDVVALAVN